jgi:hypothetical protein
MARPGPQFIQPGHSLPDLAVPKIPSEVCQKFAGIDRNHVGYMVSD